MANIENGRETVLVYNKDSGNGLKESPEKLLSQIWPALTVLSLNKTNRNPGLLAYKNIIGWAGDGTHGFLADQGAWYWPWDLGTVGDIPKSLGWMKQPDIVESTENYVRRMVKFRDDGNLKIRLINPGIINNADSSRTFLWVAGGGASSDLLMEVEKARRLKLHKTTRAIMGGIKFINCLTKDKVLEIKIGETEKQVWDVNVVNAPFGRLGSLTLPDNQGLIWTITRPTQKAERSRKIILTMADIVLMKFGVAPSGQGVEVNKLKPNEVVTIYNSSPNQVDSELYPLTGSADIYLSDDCDKAYRILVPKTIIGWPRQGMAD